MLLVVSWATAVEAQLSWAEAEAVVEPAAGQRWVEASFAFENGPAPVTVVALRTDSDRLSAELVQTSPTYGAGDTGLVKLRYRNSGVPEAEEVAVVVETDAVRDPEHRLVLKLLPPGELERRQARRELEQRRRDWQAPYVVEPRVLRWEVGESEAKTATLTLAEDAEPTTALPEAGVLELTAFPRSSGRFEVETHVVEPGRRVRITVKPTEAQTPAFERLGVTGWDAAQLEADPMLDDPAVRLRHGLMLQVAPPRRDAAERGR